MVLFTILLVISLIIVVVTALALGIVGAGTVIVFGDLIVFVIIIGGIIKLLCRKK